MGLEYHGLFWLSVCDRLTSSVLSIVISIDSLIIIKEGKGVQTPCWTPLVPLIWQMFLDLRRRGYWPKLWNTLYREYTLKTSYSGMNHLNCNQMGSDGEWHYLVPIKSSLSNQHKSLINSMNSGLSQISYQTKVLWVSRITSWAAESYFTNFLSVVVHFNTQNIRYSSHFRIWWKKDVLQYL